MKIKIIFLSIIVLLLTSLSVYASEYKKWDSKTIYDDKKSWTITFNQEYKRRTIHSSNIYILDASNKKIKVDLEVSDDHKKVIVTPIRPYIKGQTYTLKIEDSIMATDNKALESGNSLTFKLSTREKKAEQASTEKATEDKKPISQQSSQEKEDKAYTLPVQIKHSPYISEITITGNDSISTITIDGVKMQYQGNNKFSAALPKVKKGSRLNIKGFDMTNKLIHQQQYQVK